MATTGRATVCLLLILAFVASVSAGGSSGDMTVWVKTRTGRRIIGDDVELELGRMMARRVLDESSYIGYGALQADSTPCSQRGASYYNCRPGAEANPYDRGCSTITLCRN